MDNRDMRLHEQIKAARALMRQAEELVDLLNLSCHHEFRPLTTAELEDKRMSEAAHCLICGENFGWRCKKSPDRVCHYYSTEDGKVLLLDSTLALVPEGHDKDHETHDRCIYCEMPKERK
jgi:hypothetical protein